MLTSLFTNGEGYCFQPNKEGCSGSLVFVHGKDKNRRHSSGLINFS